MFKFKSSGEDSSINMSSQLLQSLFLWIIKANSSHFIIYHTLSLFQATVVINYSPNFPSNTWGFSWGTPSNQWEFKAGVFPKMSILWSVPLFCQWNAFQSTENVHTPKLGKACAFTGSVALWWRRSPRWRPWDSRFYILYSALRTRAG